MVRELPALLPSEEREEVDPNEKTDPALEEERTRRATSRFVLSSSLLGEGKKEDLQTFLWVADEELIQRRKKLRESLGEISRNHRSSTRRRGRKRETRVRQCRASPYIQGRGRKRGRRRRCGGLGHAGEKEFCVRIRHEMSRQSAQVERLTERLEPASTARTRKTEETKATKRDREGERKKEEGKKAASDKRETREN